MFNELNNKATELKNEIEKLTLQRDNLQSSVDKLASQYNENYKNNVSVQEESGKTLLVLEEKTKQLTTETTKFIALKREIEQQKLDHSSKTEKELNAILQMRKEFKFESDQLEKLKKELLSLNENSSARERRVTDDEIDIKVRQKEIEQAAERSIQNEMEANEILKQAKDKQIEVDKKMEEALSIRQAYSNKISELEKSHAIKEEKMVEKYDKIKKELESERSSLESKKLELIRNIKEYENNELDYKARLDAFEIKESGLKAKKK